jgi:tRNA U54 and U55 pseudouridine synthase Pus10
VILIMQSNSDVRIVPTDGRPLVLQIKVPRAPLGARALGVQVLGLRFVPR